MVCDHCTNPVYVEPPHSMWAGFYTHTDTNLQLCPGSRTLSDPAATVDGAECIPGTNP